MAKAYQRGGSHHLGKSRAEMHANQMARGMIAENMRRSGKTYAEIGMALNGVCAARARQIHLRFMKDSLNMCEHCGYFKSACNK